MSLFNYRYLRSDHLKGLNEYKVKKNEFLFDVDDSIQIIVVV